MRKVAAEAVAGMCAAAALAAALQSVACGDDSAGATSGAGRVTHEGGKTGCPLVDGCTGPAEKRSLISLELIPPAGFGVRQYFSELAFPSGGALNLTLRPSAQLCGAILKDYARVRGTVFAKPDPPPIAGESYSYQASVTVDGGFCVDLPAGSYMVRSVPDGTELPPLGTSVTVNAPRKDVDLSYPPDEAMLRVSGFVMADFIGIDNILVRAYDRTTGIESNSAVTTAPSEAGPGGEFGLLIPARTGTYTLLLAATPGNPDWPTVEYPDLITPETTSGLEYGFGVIPPAIEAIGVVKNMPDSDSGAQVAFRALIGNGVYTKTVQTLPGGSFKTILREGTYAITVFPPPGTGGGGITSFENVAVAAGTGPLSLPLSAKHALSGAVRYPDGAPGAGVAVSARRTGSCKTGQADPGMPAVDAVADGDGAYTLSLDSGAYDLAFVPPSGVRNALAVKRGLCVDSSHTLDVELPRSAVVTGTVFDPFGIPAAGITYNVYMNHADESGRALLIGTGVTGPYGAISVTLPDLSAP